jgi:ribosome-associated protein
MAHIEFEITKEHIRLCDLLKLTNLSQSGAQGKHFIAEGKVLVDAVVETRKTAKIRSGQKVQFMQQTILVITPAQSASSSA